MTDIALTALILMSVIGMIENILCINNILHTRYSYKQHKIGIVLDIAWIIICAVALYLGGAFAAAVISVVTVYFIITVIGDIITLVKYESVYDAVGMVLHILLLILLLSV